MRNFCGSWTRCVLLVFGLICVLSSCAGMRARSAQERYIYDQTAQHRYATPCDRVLPEVRQMLFQDGFSVKTIDTNTMTLETEWLLTDRDEEGTYEERYLIQAEAGADAEGGDEQPRWHAQAEREDGQRQLDGGGHHQAA